MHGNPWLRLPAQVNREPKQVRAQLATLEERRAALLAELAGRGDR